MPHQNKIKWRCRRGTLELDIMLGRYFDSCYSAADAQEKNAFAQLLNLEDIELLPYLLGERMPESETLASLVNKIRRFAVTDD